jgi:type II secretory pathway pseudopilin PulG
MQTNMQRGITLIETVLYLALFAILAGGTIAAVFSLIESQGRNQTQSMIEEEGAYIEGKLDWVLTSANSVTVAGGDLLVNRTSLASQNPFIFSLLNGNLYLYRTTKDSTTPPLNNPNITVTSVNFVHTTATSDGIAPESVSANFTLSARTPNGSTESEDFSTLKYLRK